MAGERRWREAHLGELLGVGLPIGAALAAAAMPVAGLIEVLVPLASAGIAVLLLHRRNDASYLTFVVWLWLLTPLLRRVVDEASGFSEQSLILLAAPLASLPALMPGLARRRELPPFASRAFAFGLIAFAYSFLSGVLQSGPVPAVLSLVMWLPPLAVGLWTATAPIDGWRLRRALGRLAVHGAIVVGAYGVYQFFLIPGWDATWMSNVDLTSIGRPLPLEVRVFSTLNSPGVMASVLGVFLIVLTATKSRLRWPAVLFGFAAFGLSLVRMAWLGFIVAIVALVASGQRRAVLNAVLIIAVPSVLLIGFDGPAQDAVTDRFDNSVENSESDKSFESRVIFHREVLPAALRDVQGRGFGSTGTAVASIRDDDDRVIAVPDSGVLDALFSMGSVIGTAFLAVVVSAAVGAWRQGRRGDPLDQAIGAAVVALAAQMVLGTVLLSASGVLFWVLIGVAARGVGGGPPPTRVGRVDGVAVNPQPMLRPATSA